MAAIKNYNDVFCKTFEIEVDLLENLNYQDIKLWDSVGHMNLIAELEDVFDIMMETDDIIDLSSYKKGIEILSTKYGIEF